MPDNRKHRSVYDKIIIGIDPGTNITGYGILGVKGNSPVAIDMGYLKLTSTNDPYEKLKAIFDGISAIVDKYKPDEAALESPFFGENIQSMLKLGRAQGVAMAACLSNDVAVTEYAPRKIKQAVAGNGAASKEQIASILKQYLKLTDIGDKFDATDGMAVALCHFFQSSSAINAKQTGEKNKGMGGGYKSTSRQGSSSWETFLAQNPDREIKG